jgi:hypothetical protein
MSVTDLEIDEAIREAWTILYAEASPSARRLAAALLAVTGGTQAHPHWVTPDDLWRDRLAVLAEQNAWLAAWGPRPGEPDCRVPPALLPESQTRRENTYLLWRFCCGAQPCGSAPMTTARAGPRTNRDPGAGMTPNNPALPAREPGGANHPRPSSNPVAVRTECPRIYLMAPAPLTAHNPAAIFRLMRKRPFRLRRLAKPPALVPRRQRHAIRRHSSRPPYVAAEQLVRKVPQALRSFFNGRIQIP